MIDDLAWDDDLPIARRSLVPGKGFFVPDDADVAVETTALDDAETVVIADPDADGLAATAMVRSVHAGAVLVPTGPNELERTLRGVARAVDALDAVYVLDLRPDRLAPVVDAIETLVGAADVVRWYDHHQWDEATATAVTDLGVDLVVGASDEVATTNVTRAELEDRLTADWSDLAAVVRDHDLWLREDPRSDDLADFAHWAGPEEFIDIVTDHGAALPTEVTAMLEERRVEKRRLIEAAVARAEYRRIGDVTVGLTYGRCSQNEVAEAMREAGADAGVVIKPSGGVSLRGTASFQRCHEVAQRLGGGGHPEAAGCKPDVFEDVLDYAHHWTTQGATVRHDVIRAFRAVLDADGD